MSGDVLADVRTTGHRGNRLLVAVPDIFASLGDDLKHVSLKQGAVIYEPGDNIDRVYFPQSGLISLLVVTEDGGAIETAMVGREGAVGLHRAFGKRRSFTRATAQIPGEFSVVEAPAFERITENSAPLRDLIGQYTEMVWAESQQSTACNAAHDAASRLCRWLLQSADKTGTEKLALTQEFLAQMLGVRRTTVTLLAQDMQKKGLIQYTRGMIEIRDRSKLEACACECYHVIEQHKLPGRLGLNW